MTVKYTHYSYISGPENMREPTGLYALEGFGVLARRQLIGRLLAQGELLCAVPWGCRVSNMAQLRKVLKWIYANQKGSRPQSEGSAS